MTHARALPQAKRQVLVTMLVAVLSVLTIGSTTPIAAVAATASPRIDLRVLVLDDGSPGVEALIALMDREGTPYDAKPLPQTEIIAATPSAGGLLEGPTSAAPHAKYQAVVLPNAAPAGLDAAELETLASYERRYGVRQVDAYLFPGLDQGLVNQWSGTLDGMTAQVTAAGATGAFSYLRGPVVIDDADPGVSESYGYLPVPASPQREGESFEALVTAQIPGTDVAGSLVGVHSGNGREELVITGSFNANQRWFQTIGHGILEWATRGVRLGYDRNYFSVHVDDVFLPDSRWSNRDKCTPGDDFCPSDASTPDIRMVPNDVTRLTSWQRSNDFGLDLVFNGGGSELWKADNSAATDPLAQALTAGPTAAQFRWINHTYEHPFLGCIQIAPTTAGETWHCATSAGEGPRQDPELPGAGVGGVQWLTQDYIQAQVARNIGWAATNGLSPYFDQRELVTGEHSGLRSSPQQVIDNPFLGPALDAEGVVWTASDASRESASRVVEGGRTATVPRHPMNIFYNAGTYFDEVSEYNWIYTSQADGGSGICSANPRTSTCIAPLPMGSSQAAQDSFTSRIKPLEVRIALSHVLTNDPRPHYAHQSNLAEDGILYPVLEGVLADYRSTFADQTPLVTPSLSGAGRILTRSAGWSRSQADVSAYLDADGVHTTGPGSVEVPVTVPKNTVASGGTAAHLEEYGGEKSGWIAAGATLVPPPVGYLVAPAPVTVPGAPGSLAARGGDRSVVLSWSAPAVDGGSPLTTYVVTPYVDGVAAPAIETGSPATSTTIGSLVNGTSYVFTVAASNVAGTGEPSGRSEPVSPAGVPDQPTAVTAVAGNGSATVSWSAPSGNGNPVASFVVTAVSVGGRSSTTSGAGTTSAVVSGLTNGVSYTFQVAAVNAVGMGSPSLASPAVVPAGPPGKPTGVTAVRGNGQVTVSWVPPSDNGSAVTRYLITSYVDGLAASARSVDGARSSFTVTGLANGTPYAVSVQAVNGVGTGPESVRSAPVTPSAGLTAQMAQPASPVTLKAKVKYSWARVPAGTAVKGYEVYVKRAAFGKPLPASWTRLGTVKKASTNIEFADGETIVVAVKPIATDGGPTVLSEPTSAQTLPKGYGKAVKSKGWKAIKSKRFVQSPALQSRRHGASLRLPRVVRADRLALVASGGWRSGVVDVYIGRERAWTVRLSKAQRSQQIFVSGAGRQRTGKVVVRVRSSDRRVRLQAIAVVR